MLIIGLLVYFVIAIITMIIIAVLFSEYDEESKSWKCYSYENWGVKEESYAAPISAGLVWPIALMGLIIYVSYKLSTILIQKMMNKILNKIKDSEED